MFICWALCWSMYVWTSKIFLGLNPSIQGTCTHNLLSGYMKLVCAQFLYVCTYGLTKIKCLHIMYLVVKLEGCTKCSVMNLRSFKAGKLDPGKCFFSVYVWHFSNNLCRCTYKDCENRAVLDCLLREVKALNPSYITEHIKGTCAWWLNGGTIHWPIFDIDAAYRFYRTRCEEASIGRRGKAPEKLKTKRRHERLTRVIYLHKVYTIGVRR